LGEGIIGVYIGMSLFLYIIGIIAELGVWRNRPLFREVVMGDEVNAHEEEV
jgi:hypothetical protein